MHTAFPQYIQFYPTMRCNLSCPFCFNKGIKTVRDISISDFEALVSIISDIGVKEIDMLGGEPTLHPEFSQILSLLYRSKMRAMISSNGVSVSSLRETSERYNGNQIKIGVSINTNSINGELHDYIVTYKPVLKSVCKKERLIPEGIKTYLGLSGIEYYLIFMDTLHTDDLKNSFPFYEYYTTINQLKAVFENLDGVFCSGFIPDINNYPILQHVRCPAGTTKIAVMPNGSVYPCYLLFRNKEFRLGNILFDDFYKIWENPVLDFFRNFEKNSCINTRCELFSLCHGGCPAISFLIFGSLNAPDPRCVYHFSCHSRLSGIFLNPTRPLYPLPSREGRQKVDHTSAQMQSSDMYAPSREGKQKVDHTFFPSPLVGEG